ncbi:MAG: dTMP kinase [Candidatus Bathyarchaeota archaeon]
MPLIVLEGIDKAGKNTQSKLLVKRLDERGVEAKWIAFPDYGTPLGKEIKKFLQGKIDLRPEVRQLLYVANRWERKTDIEAWLKKGAFVIADRYIPSGLAYGLANHLNLDWMLKLEGGLPSEDIVIIIDISTEASYNREEKKDIYEKDKVFLAKVRSSYLELARRFGWIIVNGETSVDNVSNEIWKSLTGSISLGK